ncbi:mobilization protein [Chryseobacterium sp. H3056]|uniref:Mobilization protein n=1 Tax=Kaistella daneshvariae TaxID=2487074 RepID=A0A3N0WTR0_9FLAO|nr:mobilization protein [Kaistella daneshvariae]ROI08373.1 mobilization protein [Kaistella daneshvariae]
MNLKYFEYIVIYLSVLVVCVVVGALARISFIGKGGDEYTANIVFWSITALSILFYAIIMLFLDVIIIGFRKIFRKKNTSVFADEKLISTENIGNILEEEQEADQEKSKDNFVGQLPDTANMDLIRKTQKQKKLQNDSEKLQIALDYTRNQFALYVTDEDLNALCNAVSLYSKREEVSHHFSVHTTELLTLDLYHFGWNIWNHFNVSNQEKIAEFLKNVFVELQYIDFKTIKSHLKDDERKGIIKIQNQLTG